MPTARKLSAPEVYALSQGCACRGPEECHFCASPCGRTLTHGEQVLAHTGRPAGGGPRRRPGNPYVCLGCWLWKRKKVTASYLGGGHKDGVAVATQSWFVSPAGAWAVGPLSGPALYGRLLKPPPAFFLSLLVPPAPPGNLLQTCPCNDSQEVRADTVLHFAVNNVPHAYTVYELEQGGKYGAQGREPGVRALLAALGPVPEGLVAHVAVDHADDATKSHERGRPAKEEKTRLTDARRPIVNLTNRPPQGGAPKKAG